MDAAREYIAEHPEQRRGQAYMNVLYTFDPDMHIKLPLHLDPYHRNDSCATFLKFLRETWPD
jgi:hypothetical protein